MTTKLIPVYVDYHIVGQLREESPLINIRFVKITKYQRMINWIKSKLKIKYTLECYWKDNPEKIFKWCSL